MPGLKGSCVPSARFQKHIAEHELHSPSHTHEVPGRSAAVRWVWASWDYVYAPHLEAEPTTLSTSLPSMNIKWIWHNFLMKPSGWNQLTSSQRHAPFPRFAYKRRNALQFDILPTNDIYMPLFTDSFWLFFFIACTSTHKTPNWMLIIIYLSFLSSKCQSKFLSQKITWFSSFS